MIILFVAVLAGKIFYWSDNVYDNYNNSYVALFRHFRGLRIIFSSKKLLLLPAKMHKHKLNPPISYIEELRL